MKNYITILFLCICIQAFSQSPWTKEKREFYTQLTYTTIPNYSTLFGDPDSNSFSDISDNTIQFYLEYGISDKTTIIANLPLKLITIDNFTDPRINCLGDCSRDYNDTGIGNIEIGVKQNFYKKDWILSGQFSVEANTGSYDTFSSIRMGYDAYTFTPLFLAGRSFDKLYIQSFIGANIRTNDYSSNFKIGGEIGRKISNKIWIIGFLDIVKSFYDGTIDLPFINQFNGLYVNDQEYGAFGLKGIVEMSDKFGVNVAFGGAFFGNNVAKQAALNIGIYHKF